MAVRPTVVYKPEAEHKPEPVLNQDLVQPPVPQMADRGVTVAGADGVLVLLLRAGAVVAVLLHGEAAPMVVGAVVQKLLVQADTVV